MSELPYFKFYTGDFTKDTMDFSAEQIGAYTLLLIHMWNSDGWVSNNEQKLARVARMSVKKWKAICDDILMKCIEKEGFIGNRRMLEEIKKVRSQSELSASAGALGGRAKAAKNSHDGLADATFKIKRTLPYARVRHSHSHKEEEREKVPTVLSVQKNDEPDVSESLDSTKCGSEPEIAFGIYNQTAANADLPTAQKMTAQRQSRLKARLKDCGGLDGWALAMDKLAASDYCTGKVNGWRADIDFVLQEKSFTKLMEGSYDNRAAPNNSKPIAFSSTMTNMQKILKDREDERQRQVANTPDGQLSFKRD